MRPLRRIAFIAILTMATPLFAAEFNLAPNCSAAKASAESLWPPKHTLAPINIADVTDPDGDAVDITIACISQDEPLNSTGDGDTEPDASGIGASTALVRQERSGNGNGRFYHIDFIATDAHGARCGGEVTVRVDKSKKQLAVDDGRLYQSVPTANVCGQHDINNSPLIHSEPVLNVRAGSPYSYLVQAHDPDQDPLTFTLLEAPQGMTINSDSGEIQWLPDTNVLGPYNVMVQASDGKGGTAEQFYVLWVALPLNRPPVISSTPADTVWLGENYAYGIQAHDPDEEDRITYFLNESPADASLSLLFGTLYWTPGENDLGSHAFTAEVSDNHGGSTTQRWEVEVRVNPDNRPPRITSVPETASRVGELHSYQALATDPNGDDLNWHLKTAPVGMRLSDTGLISWLPKAEGDYAVTVSVNDGRGGHDNQNFVITAGQSLQAVAPVIISEPVRAVPVDQDYQYQPQLADDDEALLHQWQLASESTGLSLDDYTGLLSGLPGLPSQRGSLLRNSACYAEPEPLDAAIQPEVLWHWQGDPDLPNSVNVEQGPLVIPLEDTNGDGVVDAKDDPAVIFVSYTGDDHRFGGRLRALSGKDGSLLWRVEGERMSGTAHFAAGDITGDGYPEILAVLENGSGTAAYNHRGELLWINPSAISSITSLEIADIDGDGSVEILAGRYILNSAGETIHSYPGSTPYHSIVADMTGDGIGEVILGQVVYRYMGDPLPGFGDSNEGMSAVADVTGDGKPDLVNVKRGNVTLYGNNGKRLWVAWPLTSWGGAPTLGDFTGDGKLEIGVAAQTSYYVYRANGSRLWNATISDWSSGATGSTLFDFNGDGRVEVLIADERNLHVFDGPTGQTVYKIPNASWTQFEYPVVADATNDGQANIVVTGNDRERARGPRGVRVLASGGKPWMPTRTIWNQNAYHINNINDDLSIPPQPLRYWETHNSFRRNAFIDRDPLARADTAIADLRVAGNDIVVTITNRGEAPGQPTAYTLLLDQQSFSSGQVPVLEPGETHILKIPVDETTLAGATQVGIELENRSLDCLHGNNRLDGLVVDLRVTNRFDLSDSQRFIVYRTNGENTAPVITAEPPATAQGNTQFTWTVPVHDADVGDAHHFALVDGPAGMTLRESSGQLRWAVPLDASGEHSFTVEVTDLAGATTTGTWSLSVVAADYDAPPFFVTEPLTVANEGEAYLYQASVQDDGGPLVWLLDEAPAGMSVDVNGEVHWPEPVAGEYAVTLRVTDVVGQHAFQSWILTVNPVDPGDPGDPGEPAPNQPPRIEAELGATVQAGGEYRRPFRFVDPDGFIAGMQLQQAPKGMNFLVLDDSNPGDIAGEIVWPVQPWAGGDFPVLLRITDDGGLSAEVQFIISVIPLAEEPNLPPEITSTPATGIYPEDDYLYQVLASDPEGGLLAYRLDDAPAGMAIDNTGLLAWPGPHAEGQYPVTVAVHDDVGNFTRQAWTLRVAANLPPVFTSAPQVTHPAGELYQYTVTAADPEGDSVALALTEGPAGMTLEGNLLQWPTTASDAGQYPVRLRATDDAGGSTDQAFNLRVELVANQSPEITSRPNTLITVGALYSYQATADDPDDDTLTWQLDDGPAGMTIDPQQGLLTWQTGVDDAGEYPVFLSVLDGNGGLAWQIFILRVDEEATDPGDNPGPTIHSTAPLLAKVGHEYRYAVEASHPDGLALQYSLEQAPAGATVDSDGLVRWTPASIGEHDFVLRVSDGQRWQEQPWTVSVEADEPLALTLDITPDPALINQPVSIQLQPALAAGAVSASLQVNGSPVALDSQLNGIFTTATHGQYQITATIDDGVETATAAATLYVRDLDAPGGPETTLHTPEEGSEVTAPTAVFGSVLADTEGADIAGWRLTWRGVDDTSPGPGTIIGEGTGAVTDAQLGQFDPTLLHNGQYHLILDAWDQDGLASQSVRTVQVAGDMKIGHFSITFDDTTIPLAGMAVTLTRTYDSRDRNQNMDFGHGWSAGYRNARLQESRAPGLGWSLNEYGTGLNVSYCVEPFGKPIVTVRLPDGELQRFRARAYPECTPLVPQVDVELRFEPLPGTYSKLEQSEFGSVRVTSHNQLVNLNGDPSVPVDPDLYTLTLQDGTELSLDQDFGIRQAREPAGNTLTFTDNGITHSSGVGIQFVRNGDNRIERVILPDGNDLHYSYSSEGDLISSTDAVGESTTYSYRSDLPHYLEDIFDARGERAVRNEYNDEGRLIGQVDADGNRLTFEHDIDGRTQVIRDRRNHATVYVYDERGNVLSETNALNETTTRTYDELGNELTRTDPLDHTWESEYDPRGHLMAEIDPLGRVTRYEHNTRGQILIQEAPDGTLVMQNSYDPNTGNLLRTTDAEDNDTHFAYDSQGNLTRMTDAEGNVTTSAYDSRGNLIRQTDAQGTVTEYTYDVMGNQLTETTTRTDGDGQVHTLVTTHRYNDNGNRIETTDALGHVTQTEYNSIGKVAAEIDALGRRTEYEYDAHGNQALTIYTDGSTQAIEYDANGNRIAQTDRAGRTTHMTYDKADRLIRTTYPDGTFTETHYDKAGRRVESIDQAGNSTLVGYDAAGQLKTTTDTQGNVTRYGYDDHGNHTSVTDANGHTTRFEYDDAGRRTRTVFPDGNDTEIAYDALGRKVSETDQDGRTTHYEYNSRGQLAAVVDTLGQRTEYGYDNQGNKLTQTDAEGRTTRWDYDDAGRVTSRTLPEGQTETFGYNAIGNQTTHTDFNGKTTVYGYDQLNREILKTYQDGTSVATTYTDGRVDTITDAEGATDHDYDEMDRLTRITHPSGQIIDYGYDARGNRTSLISGSVSYGYNALNRLESVTEAGSGTTTYTYTPVGSLHTVQRPNGLITTYSYDEQNRLKEQTTTDALGLTVLEQFTYTLDPTGQRTRLEELSGRTTTWKYDELYRLTEETVEDPVNGNRTTSWTYDKVGNRLTQTEGGATTTYAYDRNDRLQNESGASTVTYEYDDNGNTTKKQAPEGGTTYTYNDANRLTEVATPTDSLGYSYDASGIRRSKTQNGITTEYLVDPNQAYAQVLGEYQDNTEQVWYTYGHDLLSQQRNDNLSYYHYDGLGSTRALSDDAGALTDTYAYTAFGELKTKIGNSENTYLFTGEKYDPALNQYYLRARYYRPATGTMTQMDTWQGNSYEPITQNKYLYAGSNPIINIDPSGNSFITLASGGMQRVLFNISIRAPSLATIRTIGIAATGATLGVGLVASAEYLMGFPTATRKAQHEINNAAMALAASRVTVNNNERPIGHHSIPVYMCGAIEASRQQLVPLKPSVHVPLHSALVAYNAAINAAYKNVFTGPNKIFSLSNKEPLRLLAGTPQGRSVITKHLDIFYNFGWYELGEPYFRGIFQQESIKYIGGVTSLPGCMRP
jgi:RHS repeat-associated protein